MNSLAALLSDYIWSRQGYHIEFSLRPYISLYYECRNGGHYIRIYRDREWIPLTYNQRYNDDFVSVTIEEVFILVGKILYNRDAFIRYSIQRVKDEN